ncbi:hypothetical protein G3B74_003160, partial [Salmonella enterica]|nr:hypothetical protein [Salmonella enterica]
MFTAGCHYCVVINAHSFPFLLLLFPLYIMQHVFLSKINVKKRKIIHFCE